MAFVSRAARRTGGDSGSRSTGETVGPGSYISQGSYTQDHAHAPFSSTAERGLHDNSSTAQYTPGPGSYVKRGEAGAPVQGASSNNFVSKVNRFGGDKTTSAASPGPGAYAESNKWIKNTHRYKPEPAARRVTFQRMPTAPSVPARNQSYGYEEAGGGELVMQKPPAGGHSGIGPDTCGPAAYAPVFSQVQGKRHTDFSRSRAQRPSLFTNTSTPGPGAYIEKTPAAGEDAALLEPRVNAPSASSNFASRVPRAHDKVVDEQKATPGPGAYQHAQQFRAKRVPETHQFFLSTSRRGYEIDVPSQLAAPTPAMTPGPGAYDERRSSFVPPRLGPDAAPLASTGRRFDANKSKLAVPGPGSYDEGNENSFTNDLSKKVVSRNGVFGSTTQRFASSKSATSYLYISSDDTPGAGAYESTPDPNASLARLRRKETANFASSTDRFNRTAPAGGGSSAKSDVPPPGAYEVKDQWDPRQNIGVHQNMDTFISKEVRFAQPKDTKYVVPGPGHYNPPTTKTTRNPIVTNRSCFNSNSQRFASSQSIVPGPGSYEQDDPNASMVKRSFNVTIDNVMFRAAACA